MKSVRKYFLVALFTMLVGLYGQSTVSAASVEPIDSPKYGATYGELSARWWQWLLSIPAATNPNLGGDCTQGQYDDVWFLAGAFGGTGITRSCTIPTGKPIFFPVVNSVSFKPTSAETLLLLRSLAAGFIDSVISHGCTVDGEPVMSYRVRSPSFSFIAPPGALVKASGTNPMVSDGYWVLLDPLPLGTHTVHFNTATSGGFTLDMTYTLTVQ